ncbi:MAG TPA: DUF6491 family protein [Gammaproteobacteria bacterium]
MSARMRSLLAGFVVPLAGCAATPTTNVAGDRAAAVSETDCLRTSLITDWDPVDERNLIVYESRRPYHVELAQTCLGLDFATVIAFYDRSADERICGFGMDRVIVDRTTHETCGIAAVDELTEEQAEDLKRRAAESRARPRARR